MKIHEVEQNSEEWLQLRAGRITSSCAKLLVTSTGKESKSADGYALTLAAEKFAGKPVDAWDGTSWTERGHELEELAIAHYELTTGRDVLRVGFVSDGNDVGSSPDGMVGNLGGVEVKCLKAENHIKAMMYNNENGKLMPEYISQVQDQMLVCEMDWIDSIFYHPELPPFVIRTKADKDFHMLLRRRKAYAIKKRDEVYRQIVKQGEENK